MAQCLDVINNQFFWILIHFTSIANPKSLQAQVKKKAAVNMTVKYLIFAVLIFQYVSIDMAQCWTNTYRMLTLP